MSEKAAVNSRKRPHEATMLSSVEITQLNKSIHLDSGQNKSSITSKSDDSTCINSSSGEEYLCNDNNKNINIHPPLIINENRNMEEASEGFSVLDLNSENSVTSREPEPLLSIKFRDRNIEKSLKTPILRLLNKILNIKNADTVHKDLELNVWPEDVEISSGAIDTADSVSEILNTSTGSEDCSDLCSSKNLYTIDVEGDPDDLPMGIFPALPANKSFDNESQSEDCFDEDNLFMIDTTPAMREDLDVPAYYQRYNEVMQPRMEESNEDSNQPKMGVCFNCDGSHVLRDCPEPRDNARISRRRQAMVQKVGRYHMEDDQRFAHFVPGKISHTLHHALGLQKNQLPLHIYRMRVLGYPPGWLEDHKVTHSGITMFDSQGNQVMGPDDEEGEIITEGCRDKFDIKKIISFPGYNVPAPSFVLDESEYYRVPGLTEYHSKETMVSILAPNAAVAYKKRKLKQQDTCTRSPQTEKDLSSTDMEVDCDEESDGAIPGFVPPLPSTPQSLPPLPAETPPFHLMSPPPLPAGTPPSSNINRIADLNIEAVSPITSKDSPKNNKLQIVIPLAEECQSSDIIPLNEESEIKSPSSPSLSDLEERQQMLLEALDSPNISKTLGNDISELIETEDILSIEVDDNVSNKSTAEAVTKIEDPSHEQEESDSKDIEETNCPESQIIDNKNIDVSTSSIDDNHEDTNLNLSASGVSTPVRGHVRSSSLGTPILKSYTPYSKLPNAQHFSKDIADVINFENLPDSTGKYQKMKGLINRVRTVVEKLQTDS